MTYIVPEKLTFENGKSLVYKSKKSFWISLKRYLSYYSSISAISFLIYTNPCIFLVIQSRPSFLQQYLFSGLLSWYVMLEIFHSNQNVVQKIPVEPINCPWNPYSSKWIHHRSPFRWRIETKTFWWARIQDLLQFYLCGSHSKIKRRCNA